MTIADKTTFGWKPPDDPAVPLRAALSDILTVERVLTTDQHQEAVRFSGHLLQESERAFAVSEERFRELGYTPLLRREGDEDVIVAVRGIARTTSSGNILVNLVLFLLTIASTIFAGTLFTNPIAGLSPLVRGVLFSASILLILGTHEFGHYSAGRFHGVAVTLPYFIPFPLNGIGTFGAFIRMESPVRNRKALLDVAVCGPLAGLVVSIVLLAIGLFFSPIVPSAGSSTLGRSLLVDWLVNLIRPHPASTAVLLHPVAWAAYIGLLVTGINLLPAGQLDGGHAAYALLGKAARWLSWLTVFVIGALALFARQSGWFLWLAFILMSGLSHPEPLDDVSSLDAKRKVIGLATLLLLFLLVAPAPF